jgi:hypothetical protein
MFSCQANRTRARFAFSILPTMKSWLQGANADASSNFAKASSKGFIEYLRQRWSGTCNLDCAVGNAVGAMAFRLAL